MKTTTKLLLGATLVAGLSVSAFAACAADVDMGAKKLTNVANGTDDGDAVTYNQTLLKTSADIVENNSSLVGGFNTDNTHRLRVHKKGGMVCLSGVLKNFSSSAITTTINVGTIPSGFRHTGNSYIGGYLLSHGSASSDDAPIGVLIYNSGNISLRTSTATPLSAGKYMQLAGCYIQ